MTTARQSPEQVDADAATIAQLRQIVEKWAARADHGFDPEETDEQVEFWRGVRNVCDEMLVALVPAAPGAATQGEQS